MNKICNYNIIVSPAITEKTTLASENNQVVFNVLLSASKCEIKKAVEDLFEVKVVAVNTLLRKGKTKRFRNHLGKQSNVKKAFITLAKGQSIDVETGL
ncbi:50S ribosomal protein L23 [Candidatus Endowatersipora endosymbiont of Watersipora subatra]|uniref:50S ribosomal protein L23 n=1 Tax=Candidatus Endowatersipora endosymbiont of Watersipora subatra TaxID=3077946 RepID=UPI00312C7A51